MKASEMVVRARRATGLTQKNFGAVAGVSSRTVMRWGLGITSPTARQLGEIAEAVRPHDAALARTIAENAGVTLTPEPVVPAVPAVPPRPAPRLEHLSTVPLYAAASAGAISPQAVRPIVLAALQSMLDVGLSVEDMLRGLAVGAKAKTSR